MSDLPKLPPELWHAVFEHCNHADLKHIRLVSKQTEQVASQVLFYELHLKTSQESIDQWNALTNNVRLRQMPRSVIVSYRVDFEGSGDFSGWEFQASKDMQCNPEFRVAISNMSRLPNLRFVYLRQHFDCDDFWWVQWEDDNARMDTLRAFFDAMHQHTVESGSVIIQDLSLENIQNRLYLQPSEIESWSRVLTGLSSLHLQTRDDDLGDPGLPRTAWNYEFRERRVWLWQMDSLWLRPNCATLQHLSIYEHFIWGVRPLLFDTDSLHFPNLRSLSLGNYTLADGDQADWILSIKTLQTLSLDNCTIASILIVKACAFAQWDIDTSRWRKDMRLFTDHHLYPAYHNDITWTQLFIRFTNELPLLLDFQFGDTGHAGMDFLTLRNRLEVGRELFAGRYAMLRISPLERPERICSYVGGEMRDDFRKYGYEDTSGKNWQEDKQALEALLRTLEKRRSQKP